MEQIEKLVQEIVWVGLDKEQKVLNIIVIKGLDSSLDASCMVDHVTSFSPELVDTIPSVFGEFKAVQNVIKG